MTTFGSVCSGIEAASVAWGPLGWSASWLAEIEPFPCAVLAHHYPEVPNLGDMTTIARRVLTGEVVSPDVLCGGTPCFTGGQAVLSDRGYVPIESIAVGDQVVTHLGRLRKVVRIGSKVADVGVLTGVGLGEGITCTAEHPFLAVEFENQSTKRRGEYAKVEKLGAPAWIEAKDMPGKQWCSMVSATIEPPAFPEGVSADELLYIAGFYLGDGFIRRWSGKGKKAVVFGINDKKLASFREKVTQHVTVFSERTGPRVVLCNTKIADWLIECFGEYSHAKLLPAWVLSHPSRAELLNGYRATDGHETPNGWRSISVSRALAYGMRDLAQTLGFAASIAFTETASTTVIEGRTVNQRDYWTVTAFRQETSRKSRIRHGMLLRSVSSFVPKGMATVFNIEVEDDNSFILDGAIVHNCQAFSVAGLRASLDDARGNLTLKFVELANAIDHVRGVSGGDPAIVFWENVPGVLSTKDNAFGFFLAGLAGEDEPLLPPGQDPAKPIRWSGAGAVFGPQRTVAWRTLDAQYFGVAQRRRRVFVVASARNGFDPTQVLFEWASMRRDSAPRREAGEAATAGNLRSTDGGSDVDRAAAGHLQAFGGNRTSGPIEVSPALLAQPGSGWKGDFESEAFLVQPTHTLRGEGFDASEDGTGRDTPLVPVTVGTFCRDTYSGGLGGRPESAAAGHILPVCIHADAVGRTGEAVTPSPDAEGRIRLRNPGMGMIDDGTSYNLMASGQLHAVLSTVPVAYRIHSKNSTAMTGKGAARVADPVDVARALDTCGGYAANQGGNVVAQPVAYAVRTANTSANGHGISPECAPTLDQAQGQAIAFDTTQITSAANRCNPKPGDACHPLAAGAHAPAIAFKTNQTGANGGNWSIEKTHSLSRQEQAPAIAFPANLSGTQCASTENLAPAMGAKNPTALMTSMQVRRLTPRECERLQGFPDDYTLIPYGRRIKPEKLDHDFIKYQMRGNPKHLTRDDIDRLASDGPRYKALGNSWAIPVVRWIGARIQRQLERNQ